MDRGAWEATLHGVAKSRTRLSDFNVNVNVSIICYCLVCVCVLVTQWCLTLRNLMDYIAHQAPLSTEFFR